jgi:hypothetical protein
MHTNMQASDSVHADEDAASALKALGYVESDVFKSINAVLPPSRLTQIHPELEDVLRAIPPRPYTDILIQSFFESVNYQYQSIHHPSFMKAYIDWWSRRKAPSQGLEMSDIAFTGLVLQMCATAVQFASTHTLQMLESELGEAPASFSLRYHNAARRLGAFIPPGEGGLLHVQQLFLGASWLKAEAELTNTWHTLASAIREAQEIGMCTVP